MHHDEREKTRKQNRKQYIYLKKKFTPPLAFCLRVILTLIANFKEVYRKREEVFELVPSISWVLATVAPIENPVEDNSKTSPSLLTTQMMRHGAQGRQLR